jgi:hypothetical protein
MMQLTRLGFAGLVFSSVRKLIDRLVVPKGFIVARIDRGQTFFFNPSDSAQGYLLFTTGRYGAGTELMAQQLFASIVREGDIVVDVGAHYGFYTLIAASRVGPRGLVLAFEPSKLNLKVFKD